MVSKVILGPTEALVPCVPDIVPWGLERLEREAGHPHGPTPPLLHTSSCDSPFAEGEVFLYRITCESPVNNDGKSDVRKNTYP